ncbi:MAG: threonine synthase [Gemmatales bacterium]|nr:threonine synthase [Gemmatales bacterium]MDW8385926.1 threonine synthase [Gemmatales bacterium]
MFVTHLQSALDGTRFEAGRVHTTHQGRPLWVRYDLAAIRRSLRREDLAGRPPTLWRYRELLPLPVDAEPVTLGEGMTPLLACDRLAARFGLKRLWIKDESQMPTGSFKARGMAMAVSMARHFGLRRLAVPSAGNAGGALAAYAARAGLEAFLFMPADTPRINIQEALLAGARVFLVDGVITDCGRIVREGVDQVGWFDLSTLREPYRLEGKKTMGLELAEQFAWSLPDVILYPTGGGTGLVGMVKAFEELRELGWLPGDKLPRMVVCQSDGCCPLVLAFQRGERFAEPFPNPKTEASGLRVPSAVGDFMILDAVRRTNGLAVAGREDTIRRWMREVAAAEGILICPETAICFDALVQLREAGHLTGHETVVVFNTGAAQKYVELLPEVSLPVLRPGAVDYEALLKVAA